jgi:penicillin amidase
MKEAKRPSALRYINIAIAIVLIVALGLAYWYGWRPLPQRSGTIAAGVSAPVEVAFDRMGVPHIRASSLDDALFAQGYIMAQDRLWQMDALRRYTAGELAEVIPTALQNDRDSRRLRFRRVAEAGYVTLPPEDRAALAAYTRGVNQFIATHLDNLPLEFTLLGYQPRPWSVVDCLLVALYMFRDLTTTWQEEIQKRDMLAVGDPGKVEALFPVRTGTEPLPGSNGWTIAGSHTASGKPLLSNDMHLSYALPGIWYMAHIEAPGTDVSGVALPGLPGIIVGHNDRIAWGITNLGFDVQDLYLTNFDERTGRYQFHGQPGQAMPERDVIRVKGKPPEEQVAWLTPLGPLFLTEGKDAMVLRWSAYEKGALAYPILQLNRARNWQEFNAALSRFPGPGSNFVYADVDGNIGYHAAGKLPKRHGYRGDVPVDVASSDADWDGFIPYDELPAAFNPPAGIIVTANQNPFPANYPYPVNGSFAPPYRALQIRNLLTARNGWKAADLLTVQKDVYSAFDHFLAQQAVAAYERRPSSNPDVDRVIPLLRNWNGQMEKDLAAPFVTTLLFQHVRNALVSCATGNKATTYDIKMGAPVIEDLLRRRPAGWFHDYDEMLRKALADAVEEGLRMEGRDIPRWQYGRYTDLGVNNPVIHEIPWVGKYFDLAPLPMSGGPTTVRQSTRHNSPSMRLNADLGDWDRSLLNVQVGQSGQILSFHYRDQWMDHYYARSYPMQFRSVEASHTLRFEPGGR